MNKYFIIRLLIFKIVILVAYGQRTQISLHKLRTNLSKKVARPHQTFLINPTRKTNGGTHRSNALSSQDSSLLAETNLVLGSAEDKSLNEAKVQQYLKELNASANQQDKGVFRNTSYSCSEVYSGDIFYIRSPNYPFNYPSYTTCSYSIKRAQRNTCGVLLTLLRFDLARNHFRTSNKSQENGTYCGDRLTVDGQILCGRYNRDVRAFIPFRSSLLTLDFRSGVGFGASGFIIKGEQKESCERVTKFGPPLQSSRQCDKNITARRFTLRSPGFPRNYFPGLECQYTINKPDKDTCGVLITPIIFATEDNSFCIFDYVEINGKRICGSLTKRQQMYYMYEEDELSIRFRSDNSVEDKGFQLYFQQVKCDDLKALESQISPVTAFSSARKQPRQNDIFNSPDYQSIGTALSNLANVRVADRTRNQQLKHRQLPPNSPSSVTFATGNVQNNPSFLINSTSQPAVKLRPPNTRHRNGGLVLIPTRPQVQHETTEDITPLGRNLVQQIRPVFMQSVNQSPCDRSFSERVFILQSPNYPQAYPHNLKCRYYVNKSHPDVCRLRVTIEDLQIIQTELTDTPCGSDFLEISGYRFCGLLRKKIVNLAFTANSTVLKFSSDEDGNSKGFLATVEQVRNECNNTPGNHSTLEGCDVTTNRKIFTILSPGFPAIYPPNITCSTIVEKVNQNITSLRLRFDEFQVQHSPQCTFDYFRAGRRKFCGALPRNMYLIPFPQNTTTLKFVSDAISSGRGYNIHVQQITQEEAKQPVCGGYFNKQTFKIESPKYPNNYPPNSYCSYSILKSSEDVCQLRIKILDLEIEMSSACNKDYISFGLQGKICGRKTVPETRSYKFSSNKFQIVFTSDSTRQGKGFRLEITQILCQPLFGKSVDNVTAIKVEPSLVLLQGNRLLPTVDQITSLIREDGLVNPTLRKQNLHLSQLLNENDLRNDQLNIFPNTFIPAFKSNTGTTITRNGELLYPTTCNWCRIISLYRPHIIYLPAVANNSLDSEEKRLLLMLNNDLGTDDFDIDVEDLLSIQSVLESGRLMNNPALTFDRQRSLSRHIHPESIILQYDRFANSGNNGLGRAKSNFSPALILDSRKNGNQALDRGVPQFVINNKPGNDGNVGKQSSITRGKNIFQASLQTPLRMIPSSRIVFPGHQIDKNSDQSNPKVQSSSFEKAFSNKNQQPTNKLSSNAKVLFSTNDLSHTGISPGILHQNSKKASPLKLQEAEVNFSNGMKMCNTTINAQEFILRSPGYPGPFFVNMHCTYSIFRNNVNICGITVTIDMIDLPGSEPCPLTYLSIAGRRFCGRRQEPIRTLVAFPQNRPVLLEFRSSASQSGAGFSLTAKQVLCNFTEADLVKGTQHNTVQILKLSPIKPTSPRRNPLHVVRLMPTQHFSQETHFPEKFPNQDNSQSFENSGPNLQTTFKVVHTPDNWNPTPESIMASERPWIGPGGRHRTPKVSFPALHDFRKRIKKMLSFF